MESVSGDWETKVFLGNINNKIEVCNKKRKGGLKV